MRQATVVKRSEEIVDGSMMSTELMGAAIDPSYTHAIHLGWGHIMVFEYCQSHAHGILAPQIK